MRLRLAPVLLLAGLPAVLSAQTADWPGWGGPDGDHRLAPGPPSAPWPALGPPLRWELSLPAAASGYGGVAVKGSSVYLQVRSGSRERSLCLDLESGALRWESEEPAPCGSMDYGPGPFTTPLVTEDAVVFLGGLGSLRALDPEEGRVLWSRDLAADFPSPRAERGFASSPLLLGEAIIVPVGAPGAGVVALDLRNGRTLWQKHDLGSDYATPIVIEVSGRQQIVAHMEEQVIGLRPKDGSMLWSRPSKSERTRHVITPLDLGAGRILVSTTHGNECLDLNGPQPRLVWSSRRIVAQVGNLLFLPEEGGPAGMILGSSSALPGALLVALDAETGRTLWRERGVDCGFLWFAGGCLFGLDSVGELVQARVNREGLRVLNRHQVFDEDKLWSAPAPRGSELLLKGQERILCLGLGS